MAASKTGGCQFDNGVQCQGGFLAGFNSEQPGAKDLSAYRAANVS